MGKARLKEPLNLKPASAAEPSGAQKSPGSSWMLWGLFALSFLLHTIFNILVNEGPTVVIDEGLYTNIARSLAWDGELAFRGQPVNYPYLLYPFLLVPLYWAGSFLGLDIYRVIQVFNTLLITSSVFPIYLFASDFTKDKSRALTAAIIVSLMPDMLMGGFTMTEALIWPLALWMVFFCYRLYQTNELKYGLLTALFTGLMFASKPGAIAAGGTLLLLHLLSCIRNRRGVKTPLLSIALLLVIVGIVYAVFLALFPAHDSLLGLYDKQTSEWKPQDILVAGEATILLLFLFVFACGGIYGLIPYTHLKDYDPDRKRFILSFTAALFIVLAGTAIFVVPYKWDSSLGSLPLHLRYCSMFIPVMFVLSTADDSLSSPNKRYTAALIVFLVLALFPGARVGFVKGHTGTIDSMALGAFLPTRNLEGTYSGWILTALMILFLLFLLSKMADFKDGSTRKKKRDTDRKKGGNLLYTAGIVYFGVFLMFNSVCVHVSANVNIDPAIAADALEVNEIVGSKTVLGVTQRYYDDIYSYWLDARQTLPMQQVTIDQLFVTMEEKHGIYSPFVPVEQAPNIHNHETPETDTFVLGQTIAEHLDLSDSAVAQKTANGFYTVVTFEPGKPWVDAMIYGMDENLLRSGVTGYLHFFHEKESNGKVTIRIRASGTGNLTIDQATIQLTPTTTDYEVTIPHPSGAVPMRTDQGDAIIYSFSAEFN